MSKNLKKTKSVTKSLIILDSHGSKSHINQSQKSSQYCSGEDNFKKFYLFERAMGGWGEREIIHPLAHFSNSPNSPVWARPKPRPNNSILISRMGGRYPSTSVIICCLFRSIIQELDWKPNIQDLIWDSDKRYIGISSGSLTVPKCQPLKTGLVNKPQVIVIPGKTGEPLD